MLHGLTQHSSPRPYSSKRPLTLKLGPHSSHGLADVIRKAKNHGQTPRVDTNNPENAKTHGQTPRVDTNDQEKAKTHGQTPRVDTNDQEKTKTHG